MNIDLLNELKEDWELLQSQIIDFEKTYPIEQSDTDYIRSFYDINNQLNVIKIEQVGNNFSELVLYYLNNEFLLPDYTALGFSFNTYLSLILTHFIFLNDRLVLNMPDVINHRMYYVALSNLLDKNSWVVFDWNELIFIIKK